MGSFKITTRCGALTAILATLVTGIAPLYAGDPVTRGRILFLRCASCHDITGTASAKIGPNLQGVVGRKVASLPGYAYSAALRSQEFDWDAAHLDRWLRNPNEVAPGTLMAFAGIADESDRQALIAFLQNQTPAQGATAPEHAGGSAGP